jgi:DNA topoisomerase IB
MRLMDALDDVNQHRAELGLRPLVAAGAYHEWEHPRGRDGQWILKGGFIKALIGNSWQHGTVSKMNPDGTVTVRTQRGTSKVRPENIEASKAKAIIGESPMRPSYGVPRAPDIPQQPNAVDKGALRPSTEAERIAHKMPNKPQFIKESWFNPDPQGALAGITINNQGKKRYTYRQDHHTYQAAIKYHRMQAMHASMPQLLQASRKDALTDDTAAAVGLMAATGMRPGSTTKRGKVETYGATTLLNRHANIVKGENGEKDAAVFTFVGKGGKDLEIATEDPHVIAAVQARKDAANSPDDRLFNTTSDQTTQFLRANTAAPANAAVIGQLKTKDLRTYLANRIAFQLAQEMPQFQELPKTPAEFDTKRKELAAFVAQRLGNTVPVALTSYINPLVFEQMAAGLENTVVADLMNILMQQQGEE